PVRARGQDGTGGRSLGTQDRIGPERRGLLREDGREAGGRGSVPARWSNASVVSAPACISEHRARDRAPPHPRRAGRPPERVSMRYVEQVPAVASVLEGADHVDVKTGGEGSRLLI